MFNLNVQSDIESLEQVHFKTTEMFRFFHKYTEQ